MKINQIEIIGLNSSHTPINLMFNEDINIITGRNGSGKTTILKLIWYCISANIERAVREINFTKVTITTSKYKLSIEKTESKNKEITRFLIELPSGEVTFDKKEPSNRMEAVEQANELTLKLFDTSIFFPTFRRIEGGFSMTDPSRHSPTRRIIRGSEEIFIREESGFGSDIQNALESHADRLSVGNHKFVSSISTADIKQLVSKKHSDATTQVDQRSKSLSEKIFSEIRQYQRTSSQAGDALQDAVSTLNKINQDVVEFERHREGIFQSITVLSDIIITIFQHKGIRLNQRITLGDIKQSINSDYLSAGEKQMLSFLCYNSLYSNCPFFIDEPELSLHVDWQRILLDIMSKQKTNNQLFIATHSPFIYTQYPDKEIIVGNDRGNELEQ
jgi:predicted ATPase